MKKIIIQLLTTIILFSFNINLKAQENNVEYNDCKTYLNDTINSKIEKFNYDNFKLGVSECTPLIFKDNLSHKLIYTILGEPYEKAIDISYIPISYFFENRDNDEVSDITISDTQTFNSIPKISETIIVLLNIFLLILITSSIIIKIFKSQQGDTGRTNIKNIYRLIIAFGLLFPISGIGGYSFFQFILMIVIAASIMIANLLSIIIFIILTMIEIDNDTTIEYGSTFDNAIISVIEQSPTQTTLYENYSTLVSQSLCNIYQLNDTIRTNISTPKQLKINLEKDDSLLSCLSKLNPKSPEKESTKYFSTLKNCVENLNDEKYYLYKTELERTEKMKKSSITCNPYDLKGSSQNIKSFEDEAFRHALDIYRMNCKKNTIITTNAPVINNFVCPELLGFGQYQVSESDDGIFKYNLILRENVSREEENQLYENIKTEIKLESIEKIKEYILNSDSEELGMVLSFGRDFYTDQAKEKKDKIVNNLYSLFSKGWVGSFIFFNPNFISSSSVVTKLVDTGFSAYTLLTESGLSEKITNDTRVNIFNTLPQDEFTQQIYTTEKLVTWGNNSKENEQLDKEINDKILKENALTIESLMNKKDYYSCIIDNECNEIIRFNIFKEVVEKGKKLLTNGISIYASAKIVEKIAVSPLIKAAANTMSGFGIFLVTAGAFLVIILPAIPFIIFSIIVITWVYSAFKILIMSVINILSLFLESENTEDLVNKQDNIEGNLIKAVSNLFFTPIFLTLACLISMFLISIMVNILYLTLFLVIETFTISFLGMDAVSSIYMNILYLLVFIVLLSLIIIKSTVKMNDITSNLMTVLNLQIDNSDEQDIINKFIDQVKSRLFLK